MNEPRTFVYIALYCYRKKKSFLVFLSIWAYSTLKCLQGHVEMPSTRAIWLVVLTESVVCERAYYVTLITLLNLQISLEIWIALTSKKM